MATQRQASAAEQLAQQLAAGAPPISDLDKLLAQMTMRILDTAAAAELQEMALALLSPELRALAEEFGLFGLRIATVVSQIPTLEELLAGGALPHDLRRVYEAQLISERTGVEHVSVLIDGAYVFRAVTQSESEGAM